MTLDNISVQEPRVQEPRAPERPTAPQSVQNGLQKEVMQETLQGTSSIQNQMLQMMASSRPPQSVQETAQKQIEKGYLDIKV